MIKVDSIGNVTFEKKISLKEPYKSGGFSVVDHDQISKWVMDRSFEIASVIMICEPLREDLYDDPQFMHQEREIQSSDFECELFKFAKHSQPDLEEVTALIKRNKFPKTKTNHTKNKEEDQKFYYEIENLIWKAYDMLSFPRFFLEYKNRLVEEIREQMPDLKSKEDIQSEVRARMIQAMLPNVFTYHTRVFDVPEPLNNWDERNLWQQWYFVDKGDRVDCVQGGSGSSGQRERHGRWGHAFARLGVMNYEAPTYVIRYDQFNKLSLCAKYEKFKAVRQDLTGNYGASWEKTKNLFTHRLLVCDHYGVKEV